MHLLFIYLFSFTVTICKAHKLPYRLAQMDVASISSIVSIASISSIVSIVSIAFDHLDTDVREIRGD